MVFFHFNFLDPVVSQNQPKIEENRRKNRRKIREKKKERETNRWNFGLISVARRARPTRIRTIPSPKSESSTKDLIVSTFVIIISKSFTIKSELF